MSPQQVSGQADPEWLDVGNGEIEKGSWDEIEVQSEGRSMCMKVWRPEMRADGQPVREALAEWQVPDFNL